MPERVFEFIKAIGWFWVTLLSALAAAAVAHLALMWTLRHAGPRASAQRRRTLARHVSAPSRWAMLLAAAWLVLPLSPLAGRALAATRHGLGLALIAAVTWTLLRLARAGREMLLARYTLEDAGDIRSRKVHTQLRVMYRLLVAMAIVLAGGAMLMTFDTVRQFGASLLASAGVAGIVIGVAAQRSLGSVIAGVQLALTQPLRLNDAVIVEGEWGRVEEITLTYVVIRIWDMRRLVLPTTYFVERPFQNWTLSSENLTGAVLLYADYRVPVQAVRQ